MEHIHLLVSTLDTHNVAVAHNLRSCSRPPSETKTKTKTSKSGLDRSRDQDQVSRPTSLFIFHNGRSCGHKHREQQAACSRPTDSVLSCCNILPHIANVIRNGPAIIIVREKLYCSDDDVLQSVFGFVDNDFYRSG